MYRVAIIGCGSIFPMHAVSLAFIDRAEIVAVCDVQAKVAKRCAEEYGCNYYTDYKKMIATERPDVVHICLPHYLHDEVSIYAMENKCHVLCEKPMAISVAAAQNMIHTSERCNRTLGVIFQNRYNPASKLIKSTLESGELGNILGGRASVWWHRSDGYYAEGEWRGRLKHAGGGVVANQAIHTLDLLLWFVGEKPYSVVSSIDNLLHPDIEVEDDAHGIIKFERLVCYFNFTNNYSYDAPVEVELHCENGTAKLVGDTATILFNDGRVLTASQENEEKYIFSNPKEYWGTSHLLQISDFYKSLESRSPLYIDLESVLITTKVMCAILKSGK